MLHGHDLGEYEKIGEVDYGLEIETQIVDDARGFYGILRFLFMVLIVSMRIVMSMISMTTSMGANITMPVIIVGIMPVIVMSSMGIVRIIPSVAVGIVVMFCVVMSVVVCHIST